MIGPGLELVAEAAVMDTGIAKQTDVSNKIQLPDDSGERRFDSKLPDDSGERRFDSKLPDDFREKTPVEKLSPEEIAQKQNKVIRAVETGEIQLKTNMKKGNYGEMKGDQCLRGEGYQRISENATTSLDAPPHQGIDGVYYNPDGHPPYLIVDVKYNTSSLETDTKDGPQMSEAWIDKRLDAAVGKDKADEIRMAQLKGEVGCYVINVAKGDNLNAPVSYNLVDSNGQIVEKDVKINAA